MEHSVRGRLLVANPELGDPNFERTIILMLEHSADGALGLVLNRPTDVTVGDVLPAWVGLAVAPAVVHVGGPVQPEAAIGVARRVDGASGAEGGGFSPLFADLGTVDLEREPDAVSPAVDRVRVFTGYSGWGGGQLERELADDGWFVVDAAPEDPWARDAATLWRGVLRRQHGSLQVFADFPTDPAQN